jgi:hypothetical protein
MDESEEAIVDAEQVIGKVIDGQPVSAAEVDTAEHIKETVLDEADDIGDIDEESGMSIQDIDEVNEIKEAA